MINNYNSISMKNKFKILTLLAIGIFLFPTCQKDPDLRWPAVKYGVIPLIQKDQTKNLVIFDNDVAGFAGSVTCDLYPYVDKPKSMSLMVTLNNDPAKSAAAIANIPSFPATYNFTAADLVALLPGLNNISEIKRNDFFRFYADITLEDGTVLSGNDTLYTQNGSEIYNLPNSSPEVTYSVVCGYVPALAVGSYHSKSPDWNSEGDITITADPADPYKLYVVGLEVMEGLVEDVGPLVMNVNKFTFAVTGPKSVLCSTAWGYNNLAYKASGLYNSCDGSFSLKMAITVDEGSFGNFTFKFTRNN